MSTVVFVDAGVLIAAARGTDEVAQRAMEVLDQSEVEFASSPFVRLEALPKPKYFGRAEEAEFYETFFDEVTAWAQINGGLIERAEQEAVEVGLAAMDALHVTAAAATGADLLVTTERRTSPLHRTRTVAVQTISPT